MREEANQLMWQNGQAEDDYRFAAEVDATPWKVMIVDDEESIHAVTQAVLQDFEFEGKKLSFIHAYTKEEAKRLIRENPDTVAFLLDVVMDGEKAGLEMFPVGRGGRCSSTRTASAGDGLRGSCPQHF